MRARLAAVRAMRQARQQLSGFLLRHGHHYNRPAWTLMHRRWLAGLTFEHAVYYIVLEDCIAAVEAATARRDGLEAGFSFVRSQIIKDDDVVGLEGWDQELLDVGEKALAVDGAVEETRRFNTIAAQCGQEGRRLPVAVRRFCDEALAARGPAVEAGHVGPGPGLVDEHQARRIDALLMASPAHVDAPYM